MKNGYNDYFNSIKKNKNSQAPAQEKRSSPASNSKKMESKPVAKKMRQKFPMVGLLSLGALVSLTALYLTDPSLVEKIGDSIQISLIPKLEAAEENKSQAGDAKKENLSQTSTAPAQVNSTTDSSAVLEDSNYIKKLNDRKLDLDQREVALNDLEAELHKQRLEIEERIKQLEQLRQNLSGMLQEKVDVDDEKVTKLVEFYANMKPKQAADIISTLNEDLAVEILGRMKKKNAAEILNLLPPKKAQMFSERYAGYTKND